MTRWMAGFGCALIVALAMPLGNGAKADGVVRHGYGHKKCIASRMLAPQTTWVCAASSTCCYDWLRRKGTCIAPTARCI